MHSKITKVIFLEWAYLARQYDIRKSRLICLKEILVWYPNITTPIAGSSLYSHAVPQNRQLFSHYPAHSHCLRGRAAYMTPIHSNRLQICCLDHPTHVARHQVVLGPEGSEAANQPLTLHMAKLPPCPGSSSGKTPAI